MLPLGPTCCSGRLLAAVCLVLGACLCTGPAQAGAVGDFTRSMEKRRQLSPRVEDDVELFWTVDTRQREIMLAVMAGTTGWVGLGLSDKGTMKGADIAIVQGGQSPSSSGGFSVGDYYSRDFVAPERDPEHLQNFVLLAAERNSSHTAFLIKRPLVTCDDLDLDIGIAPVYVMYALGPQGVDHVAYHGATRGSRIVSFILDELVKDEPPVPPSRRFVPATLNATALAGGAGVETGVGAGAGGGGQVFALDLAVDHFANYTLPSHQSTTYVCFKFDLTEQLGNTPLHMFGFSALAHRDRHAHHAHILACSDSAYEQLSDQPTPDCYVMPDDCTYAVSWAVGMDYVEAPHDVSGVLGGERCGQPGVAHEECKRRFVMQVHYENPGLDDDVKAAFGFRLFFRLSALRHEYGLYILHAPRTGILVPAGGTSSYSMECPSECTSQLPAGGVKVFLSFLHAHLTATSLRLRHVRDGVELATFAEVDVFDFNKQAAIPTNRVILPGDRLILECNYDGRHKTTDTVGGFGTSDEMCMGVVAYYPRHHGNVVCGVSAREPGRTYCGREPNVAFNDSMWPAHQTLHVPVPAPPFTPLDPSDEVCHMAMFAGIPNPFGWVMWPVHVVILYGSALAVCQLTGAVLWRTSRRYRGMKVVHKQNVKVYISSTLALTASLILMMGWGHGLLTGTLQLLVAGEESGVFEGPENARVFQVGVQLMGTVMLLELSVKVRIDGLLLAHHTITIALVSVLYSAFYATLDTGYAQVAVFLCMYATTEQPMYLALLHKRFGACRAHVRRDFVAAAVYTLVVKTTLFALCLRWYLTTFQDMPPQRFSWLPDAVAWNEAMGVAVPIMVTLLYVVQLVGVHTLLSIAGVRVGPCGNRPRHGSGKGKGARVVGGGRTSGEVVPIVSAIGPVGLVDTHEGVGGAPMRGGPDDRSTAWSTPVQRSSSRSTP